MKKDLSVKRYELKYYINRADYEYCKAILFKLMKNDTHQTKQEGYFIRSLYFDDIYDTSVEEKLAGVEKRKKYRLRIYNPYQDWVKLECKRKENNYTQKSTAVITKSEAINIINGKYEEMLKYNNPQLNSIYFDFKKKYLKPIVIVDYVRDAFILKYNNIRITFDQKLKYSDYNLDMFDKNISTKPLQPDEVIIMEVKFNHFLPSWFRKTLKLESLIESAVSKYCQSRLKMGDYIKI